MIAGVVHGFYDRVRADPLLAPVFAARLADADWPAHLGRMVRFWAAVILMDGGYHGRPMQRHAALPVDGSAFRPLARAVPERSRAGAARMAAVFVERAERIAESLETGIAWRQGRDSGGPGVPVPEARQ